jgi:hypothetical protein
LAAADERERKALEQQGDELTAQLTRLKGEWDSHPLQLFPPANQVQTILGAAVSRKVGAIRYERIPSAPEPVALAARELHGQFVNYLDRRPPSSSAHNLTSEEKAARREAEALWCAEGRELLDRIRALAGTLERGPGPAQTRALRDWLTDCEAVYEFDVRDRAGVLAALGRWHGDRLRRLLRVRGQPAPVERG